MDQVFSGAHTTRPSINLGGQRAGGNSQADLIRRAREEREGREQARAQLRAGIAIQAFYRGRRAAGYARDAFRTQFDQVVAQRPVTPELALSATALLAFLFQVQGGKADTARGGAWCRALLEAPSTDQESALYQVLRSTGEARQRWRILSARVALRLLDEVSANPSIPQAALFLETVKLLSDSATLAKRQISPELPQQFLARLLREGLHQKLQRALLAIPPESKTHITLPSLIALALLPFKVFPAAPVEAGKSSAPPDAQSPRGLALRGLLEHILSTPLLPNRIPTPSLTLLAGMPFGELMLFSSTLPELATIPPQSKLHLLANIVALGSRRVPTFKEGKVVGAYMTVLQRTMDGLEDGVLERLAAPQKADVPQPDQELDGGSEDEAEEEVVARAKARIAAKATDEDGDAVMASGPAATRRGSDGEVKQKAAAAKKTSKAVDQRTMTFLNQLASVAHLGSLVLASVRFSATTRPALIGFFVSFFMAWPSKKTDAISAILYSTPPAAAGARAGPALERGGGILREIWRGYLRSSALSKHLISAGSESQALNVRSILANEAFTMDFKALVLLTEIYSRCLVTLGDDEFFDTSRNPLLLEEVVDLSGMLRTLAFHLYWQEGSTPGLKDLKVREVGISVEQLRRMATKALQLVYARDSRRTFAPDGHWIMTNQFQLGSFVQAVLLDEQSLEEAQDPDAADEDGQADNAASRARARVRSAKISRSQMALISPRLGVLNNIPFVIPFDTRVAIFRQFVRADKQRLDVDRHAFSRRGRTVANIRRDHIAEDSFTQLNGLGSMLKRRVEIKFVDEFGLAEEGIDGGGLFKELLTSLSKEVFDADRGLWLSTKKQELYPNPHPYAREARQLSWYSFLGRILGKALYEEILVDVRFAGFFLSKWLGKQSYLDDLASLDEELYNGLIFLKNYTGNVEADLSLNFTVTDDDLGVSRTIDLMPNGSAIPVTNENRISYIYLMSHYRLNTQIEKQCNAFFAGLSEIIPERFLRMFNMPELRLLVGGTDADIDIDDLRRNTVYGGFEGEEANDTIRMFWSVLHSFDNEERAKFLKFTTSCGRAPLLGFEGLQPRFGIRNTGNDETRLPSSSTCFNLLKLPSYSNVKTLKEKLLYAINSGAGFGLS